VSQWAKQSDITLTVSHGSEDAKVPGTFGTDVMSAHYRVFSPDGDPIGDADSIDAVAEIARNAATGRYRIDRISTDPGSGVPTSCTWGAVIKSRKGRITLDAPPWID
jgi:hypothetical protein